MGARPLAADTLVAAVLLVVAAASRTPDNEGIKLLRFPQPHDRYPPLPRPQIRFFVSGADLTLQFSWSARATVPDVVFAWTRTWPLGPLPARRPVDRCVYRRPWGVFDWFGFQRQARGTAGDIFFAYEDRVGDAADSPSHRNRSSIPYRLSAWQHPRLTSAYPHVVGPYAPGQHDRLFTVRALGWLRLASPSPGRYDLAVSTALTHGTYQVRPTARARVDVLGAAQVARLPAGTHAGHPYVFRCLPPLEEKHLRGPRRELFWVLSGLPVVAVAWEDDRPGDDGVPGGARLHWARPPDTTRPWDVDLRTGDLWTFDAATADRLRCLSCRVAGTAYTTSPTLPCPRADTTARLPASDSPSPGPHDASLLWLVNTVLNTDRWRRCDGLPDARNAGCPTPVKPQPRIPPLPPRTEPEISDDRACPADDGFGDPDWGAEPADVVLLPTAVLRSPALYLCAGIISTLSLALITALAPSCTLCFAPTRRRRRVRLYLIKHSGRP